MKKLIFIFLLLALAAPAHAATYTYYFDISGGNDGETCTVQGSPCRTIAKINSMIAGKSSSDTVNINLKRGETWSVNTDAYSPYTDLGIKVLATGPIVNIDAYGSGAKPIIDGTMSTDFSWPGHNETTGPVRWSCVLSMQRDNSTVKNIRFQYLFGGAIRIGGDSGATDYITVESCEFYYIGGTTIRADDYHGTSNSTITKNHLQRTAELFVDSNPGINMSYDWGIGITLQPVPGTGTQGCNNTVSFNVLDGIGGEGIHGSAGTVEYNIVGDTGSVALYVNPFGNDACSSTVVRYNLVTMSAWSSSIYDDLVNISPDGIYLADEGPYGGSTHGVNTSGNIEVYGNVVINRNFGIVFNDFDNCSPWASVKIYNNTAIDNYSTNYVIGDGGWNCVASGQGYFFNNASILYDRTGGIHAGDWGDPAGLSTYWTITNNAFWTTGGSPTVDSDWQTNYEVGNPLLSGEAASVNWDGQTGATYWSDITIAHITPASGSSLFDEGASLSGYERTYLSSGDWSTWPGSASYTTAENEATEEIGAIPEEGEAPPDPGSSTFLRLLGGGKSTMHGGGHSTITGNN